MNNTTRVDLEQLEKNLDANDINGKCAIAGLHIFGLIAELKESRVEISNLREKIANLEKDAVERVNAKLVAYNDIESLQEKLNRMEGERDIAQWHLQTIRAEIIPAEETKKQIESLKSQLAEAVAQMGKLKNVLTCEAFRSHEERLCQDGAGLTKDQLIGATIAMIWVEGEVGLLALTKPTEAKPAGEDGSTPQSAVDQSVIEKANKILEEKSDV